MSELDELRAELEVTAGDALRERARANRAEARLADIAALAEEHRRLVTPAPYTTERALIERLTDVLDLT